MEMVGSVVFLFFGYNSDKRQLYHGYLVLEQDQQYSKTRQHEGRQNTTVSSE